MDQRRVRTKRLEIGKEREFVLYVRRAEGVRKDMYYMCVGPEGVRKDIYDTSVHRSQVCLPARAQSTSTLHRGISGVV